MRTYKYTMGFKVTPSGGTSFLLPDPSEMKYQVSDLDTKGTRDTTGLLHRHRVAQKIKYELKWNALDWEMLCNIIQAVDHQHFTFQAPSPINFNRKKTGKYYVGDREGTCLYYLPEKGEKAQFDLELHFIEF